MNGSQTRLPFICFNNNVSFLVFQLLELITVRYADKHNRRGFKEYGNRQ